MDPRALASLGALERLKFFSQQGRGIDGDQTWPSRRRQQTDIKIEGLTTIRVDRRWYFVHASCQFVAVTIVRLYLVRLVCRACIFQGTVTRTFFVLFLFFLLMFVALALERLSSLHTHVDRRSLTFPLSPFFIPLVFIQWSRVHEYEEGRNVKGRTKDQVRRERERAALLVIFILLSLNWVEQVIFLT